MLFSEPLPQKNDLQLAIANAYRQDETEIVHNLLAQLDFSQASKERIAEQAAQLVQTVRQQQEGKGGIEAFMQEYDLSSEEGIALMCIAEALLRIPDKQTIDKLIRDKITAADWVTHRGKSASLFVNATTWGLMLTGKILSKQKTSAKSLTGSLKKLVERTGEPFIRKAVAQAIRILGKQFVMGRNIDEALRRAQQRKLYRYSFDMLGEAARTIEDAEKYYQAYVKAIAAIGKATQGQDIYQGHGISVKLSALYPRYEFAQRIDAVPLLSQKLLELAQLAKAQNIGLTVDAEESERLEISLEIITIVFADPSLADWQGLGLALQSYQKRAWYVIDWLADLARQHCKRWMLRLIKGAYWDSEIKRSQELGLASYPVFTRKTTTDVSFIACAKKILAATDAFYPQFATHNAHTVATILEMAGSYKNFEFQRLHGMGAPLYQQVVEGLSIPCRVYAPVGSHEDLLAYLVRRLLENGANSSFVNRIVDAKVSVADIIADPIAKTADLSHIPHPQIPLPENLYQGYRKNSLGFDVSDTLQLSALDQELQKAAVKDWLAKPMLGDIEVIGQALAVTSPNDRTQVVGHVVEANIQHVDLAVARAVNVATKWNQTPLEQRAACLEKAGELLQQHRAELIYLAIQEAGKTLNDAIAEVREAVDFCYYYAANARRELSTKILPGPTGETNRLEMHGRGPIVCISPWNFPLAIFVGQVAAAIVAGNPVLAKPAEQTPLIAALAVAILQQAGIPGDVLQLLPGTGEIVGARLVANPRVQGIMFTGSTETARQINKTLAERQGPIIPFIAETGGQNVMLVDSSCLPEQTVMDAMQSAFGSAGQRCSALRVLFVQEEVADKVIHMLRGAMAELKVAHSQLLASDIGPVIDQAAKAMLAEHKARLDEYGKLIYQVPVEADLMAKGDFFAPCAYEIDALTRLEREVFGPILHVIRYKQTELDAVILAINNTGYGLTLGIQSRINETIEYILQRVHVGNSYINRTMIGAVVGVQPFGGEGLSGTGPKAGGPHYLARLCTERVITINTTASGGNASLMSLRE
jgi:RHH-type proline utilization regulon transcriptional repressor/proline dehydrogenase/delta 1-pyrroline-5-carboxylate dehydrogenase